MSTLHVTVGARDHIDEETRSRIEAAQDGSEFEEAEPILNVESYAELGRLLSPKNLELLHAIHAHDPDSIRETAEWVDRDYKQVHQNLSELADIGIIDFEGGGSGRAKRPRLAYDGLDIDIPFSGSNPNVSQVTP